MLIFFQISKLCFVVAWLFFFLVDRSPFAFSRWFFLSQGVLACLCLFAFSKPVVWSSVDEVAVRGGPFNLRYLDAGRLVQLKNRRDYHLRRGLKFFFSDRFFSEAFVV